MKCVRKKQITTDDIPEVTRVSNELAERLVTQLKTHTYTSKSAWKSFGRKR